MVDFDSQAGREQAGIRPALVISSDQFNRMPHELVIVVPLTRTNRGVPQHVPIRPPEGGLTQVSFAMCDQEKSQSVQRFLLRRGQVAPETSDAILKITARLIGQ